MKVIRLLLSTICCFLATLQTTSFATEEQTFAQIQSVTPALFELEFNEQSVKTYAEFKGINFEDAKNTFGYKHNSGALTSVVRDVSKYCSDNQLDCDYETKNCMATMLYQTIIGGKEISFTHGVEDMLYALVLLNNDCEDCDIDEKYIQGLSYVNCFLFYKMLLQYSNLGNIIFENMLRSAKSDLYVLLTDACYKDETLKDRVEDLLKQKYNNIDKNPYKNINKDVNKDRCSLVEYAFQSLDCVELSNTETKNQNEYRDQLECFSPKFYSKIDERMFHNMEKFFKSNTDQNSVSFVKMILSSKINICTSLLKKEKTAHTQKLLKGMNELMTDLITINNGVAYFNDKMRYMSEEAEQFIENNGPSLITDIRNDKSNIENNENNLKNDNSDTEINNFDESFIDDETLTFLLYYLFINNYTEKYFDTLKKTNQIIANLANSKTILKTINNTLCHLSMINKYNNISQIKRYAFDKVHCINVISLQTNICQENNNKQEKIQNVVEKLVEAIGDMVCSSSQEKEYLFEDLKVIASDKIKTLLSKEH